MLLPVPPMMVSSPRPPSMTSLPAAPVEDVGAVVAVDGLVAVGSGHVLDAAQGHRFR